MSRPDPQMSGYLALVSAGILPPGQDPLWCVKRADSPDAARIFNDAYMAAAEGHIWARDADSVVRLVPAEYAGQSKRPGPMACCSHSRAGVYRLDTGRLVWADVGGDDVLQEHAGHVVEDRDVIAAPLPSLEAAAAAYASHQRARAWTVAQANGAGVVVG